MPDEPSTEMPSQAPRGEPSASDIGGILGGKDTTNSGTITYRACGIPASGTPGETSFRRWLNARKYRDIQNERIFQASQVEAELKALSEEMKKSSSKSTNFTVPSQGEVMRWSDGKSWMYTWVTGERRRHVLEYTCAAGGPHPGAPIPADEGGKTQLRFTGKGKRSALRGVASGNPAPPLTIASSFKAPAHSHVQEISSGLNSWRPGHGMPHGTADGSSDGQEAMEVPEAPKVPKSRRTKVSQAFTKSLPESTGPKWSVRKTKFSGTVEDWMKFQESRKFKKKGLLNADTVLGDIRTAGFKPKPHQDVFSVYRNGTDAASTTLYEWLYNGTLYTATLGAASTQVDDTEMKGDETNGDETKGDEIKSDETKRDESESGADEGSLGSEPMDLGE